jgi:hypothetical protein
MQRHAIPMHYKKAPRQRPSSRRLGAAPYRTISLRGWWHLLSDYRQIARRFICEEPRNSVAIPSCGILSERSSPSRVRVARARGAPLTAPGRSEPIAASKEWGFSGVAPGTQSWPWAVAEYTRLFSWPADSRSLMPRLIRQGPEPAWMMAL